jgi:hypothetical protein
LIEEGEMIRFKQQLVGSLVVVCIITFWCVSLIQAKDEGSNANHRLALNFNEAMNRCFQSGCTNIEEVIDFFTDESSYLDDSGQLWNGKAGIRKRFLRTPAAEGTSDRIEGIDVTGSVVTLRLERRRIIKAGKYDATEVKPHIQVIVVKGGRIARLISVIPPEEK